MNLAIIPLLFNLFKRLINEDVIYSSQLLFDDTNLETSLLCETEMPRVERLPIRYCRGGISI